MIFTPRAKEEHVNEHQASTAVQDIAKETHFSLALCRILICGVREDQEGGSEILSIKGMQFLLTVL